MSPVVFTRAGLNSIPQLRNESFCRVMVAVPVSLAEKSCPTCTTNVPVVKAGFGFNTFSNSIDILAIAESEVMAPDIVSVFNPSVPPSVHEYGAVTREESIIT